MRRALVAALILWGLSGCTGLGQTPMPRDGQSVTTKIDTILGDSETTITGPDAPAPPAPVGAPGAPPLDTEAAHRLQQCLDYEGLRGGDPCLCFQLSAQPPSHKYWYCKDVPVADPPPVRQPDSAASHSPSGGLQSSPAGGGVADPPPAAGQISDHEGYREQPYEIDGKEHMGFGELIDTRAEMAEAAKRAERTAGNIRADIEKLDARTAEFADAAEGFFGRDAWAALDECQRTQLTDLAYWVGATGITKFVRLRRAVASEDWSQAYREVKLSDACDLSEARCDTIATGLLGCE